MLRQKKTGERDSQLGEHEHGHGEDDNYTVGDLKGRGVAVGLAHAPPSEDLTARRIRQRSAEKCQKGDQSRK